MSLNRNVVSAQPCAPERRKNRIRGSIPVAALVAAIALWLVPGAALAQQDGSPAANQYGPAPEQIEEAVERGVVERGVSRTDAHRDGDGAAAGERVVSALPFTGFDLGILGAAALLLSISGLTLRRLTRPEGSDHLDRPDGR